jgi:Uma2 family endonuclease
MIAVRKKKSLTIQEFILSYEGTRFEFVDGQAIQTQATGPNHGYIQLSIGSLLKSLYGHKDGPKRPPSWWFITESAVRYGDHFLFSHDIAGWRKALVPERPRQFPITERPDWVCEILSSNVRDDTVKKKKVLHDHEVPYYWIVNPNELIISVFEWSERGYLSILDVEMGYEGIVPPFTNVPVQAALLFGEEDSLDTLSNESPDPQKP